MATEVSAISAVSNDAQPTINFEQPYTAEIRIKGVCPFLFHAWSVEGVEAKSKAAKGSKAKKEDDLESYVYRTLEGNLAIPSEYFRMSIINAAKFKQDPRSPRKSAMDLFKAAVFPMTDMCDLGKPEWDCIHRARVMIQRQGVTRSRPMINTGYEVTLLMQVVLPEYVSPELLNETLQLAGRVTGVGDFRPTFGRFQVTGFKVLQ